MDSSGWSLEMGLGGTGFAAPSSARQEGNLRAFTRSSTGAGLAVNGLLLSGASMTEMERAASSGLTAVA